MSRKSRSKAVKSKAARQILFFAILAAIGCGSSGSKTSGGSDSGAKKAVELLNVSYDPTRELWVDINKSFISKYAKETGTEVSILQSHGGSSTQARSVIEGQDADVVTLAMWTDTDAIRAKGLIHDGWEKRLPERSLPYYSTIVFVVREGNPRNIKDWNDLTRDDVEIVTPNPKTSGNGKLSFLAAWGSVIKNGGTDEQATEFVTRLYQHTPVLDSGARGATTTFVQKGIGDVHLAWENEAHLEVKEAKGKLQLVYPSISIRAEPHVAVVDANVERKGTAKIAQAYLEYLYTDAAQETIGTHFYRPINAEIAAKFLDTLPAMKLFTVEEIAPGWAEADKRFFQEGGVFDSIYAKEGK